MRQQGLYMASRRPRAALAPTADPLDAAAGWNGRRSRLLSAQSALALLGDSTATPDEQRIAGHMLGEALAPLRRDIRPVALLPR